MLIGRLQDQGAVPGIFRFDGALTGDAAPKGFAEQVAHPLDAGGGVDVAHRPLHGSGLEGDICLAQVTDDLALAHIHGVAVIGQLGAARHDTQVLLVFYHGKWAQGVEDLDVVIVGKIVDLIHGVHPFFCGCRSGAGWSCLDYITGAGGGRELSKDFACQRWDQQSPGYWC